MELHFAAFTWGIGVIGSSDPNKALWDTRGEVENSGPSAAACRAEAGRDGLLAPGWTRCSHIALGNSLRRP